MADFIKMELTGMKELQDKIVALAQSVEPDKVEPLLLEGANIIRDAAKSRVPVATGTLQRAIISKLLPRQGINRPRVALAGVDRRKAPHAWLVEFGVQGTYASPGKPATGREAKKGSNIGRPSGPMPARPFFRQAWDSRKRSVLDGIIKGLKKLIEESVKT